MSRPLRRLHRLRRQRPEHPSRIRIRFWSCWPTNRNRKRFGGRLRTNRKWMKFFCCFNRQVQQQQLQQQQQQLQQQQRRHKLRRQPKLNWIQSLFCFPETNLRRTRWLTRSISKWKDSGRTSRRTTGSWSGFQLRTRLSRRRRRDRSGLCHLIRGTTRSTTRCCPSLEPTTTASPRSTRTSTAGQPGTRTTPGAASERRSRRHFTIGQDFRGEPTIHFISKLAVQGSNPSSEKRTISINIGSDRVKASTTLRQPLVVHLTD